MHHVFRIVELGQPFRRKRGDDGSCPSRTVADAIAVAEAGLGITTLYDPFRATLRKVVDFKRSDETYEGDHMLGIHSICTGAIRRLGAKATRVVITNPELGIYVGNAMGLGFWSMMDAAGADSVVTFASELEAREFVVTWDCNGDPEEHGYVALVPTGADDHATLDDLREAGLDGLIGHLSADEGSVGHA